MLNIDVRIEGIDKFLSDHDPRKVTLAIHSALNKVAQQARTKAADMIGSEFVIQKSRINKFLRVSTRSAGNSFSVVITGQGMGISLAYFGARQEGVKIDRKLKKVAYNKRSHRSGNLRYGGRVSVQVKRGAGQKFLSGSPKPFMAILKSGHQAIFQRTGKGRLPVEPLFGPGVGGLFGSDRIRKEVGYFIDEKFEPIFLADLKWRQEK